MPAYEFRCGECDAARDVLVDYERSRELELICLACGGTMRVAPVLSVRVQGFSATAVEDGAEAGADARSCGHSYACRCNAVRLTRPNPLVSRPSPAE
ncbi:zinc ribbon domain-containing protein [Ancylobacter mangrovi]|uniref:zinc ribbon domain-containing protein n=1 Tax=Ancylobacter mangrovi TaxID=2972472 RepID=UPI002162AAA1|nr:zinc ribbon domain-containing protein [Ancylobacter mangrovi]MCS0502911.1 zinc ribbon domain-containing protein [Ancylobacter mangrovi]